MRPGEATCNHFLLPEERRLWRRTVDMKLLHAAAWTFFFCQAGSEAQTWVHGEVGRGLTMTSRFSFTAVWRIFCRNNCSRENILIETRNDSARAGRFSLGYESRGIVFKESLLSVGVSALSRSDAGLYLCGLLGGSAYIYSPFRIVVVDVVLKETSDRPLLVEAGRSLTVACSFQSPGNTKFFCRGGCYGDNVLVQTNGGRTQNGRFSIRSEGGAASVSIEPLQPSDSGWFRCSERFYSQERNIDFYVIVTDESPESGSPPDPRPPADPRPPPDPRPPDFSSPSALPETTAESKPGQNHRTDLLISVGVTLTVVVVLLGAALLAFCRKPAFTRRGRPSEETSSTQLKLFKRPRGRSGSSGGGAGGGAGGGGVDLHTGEEDSGGLIYSSVVFSRSRGPDGAPCRAPEDVVYSLPRAARSSTDDPLYSNVTLHGAPQHCA